MPLTQCPGCTKSLKIPDALAGKKVKCPRCGRAFAVGEADSAAGRAAAAGFSRTSDQATRSLAGKTDAGAGQEDRRPGPDLVPPELLAPPQGPDELGRLAQYRVLEVLGRGGMGMVFRAEDTDLRRHVALKVMLPTVASGATARERFVREARAAAAIEHEHIIAIYQVGVDRDVPFLAMPLLKGRPLDRRLKEKGRLPAAEAVRIGREVAEGLAAAHEQGLIHRDIKPANIWLEGERRKVKVLDFGLARAANDATHLTHSGAIVGTPSYMAPEQARGAPVDARADLFSLGCVLYEMCTGRRAFGGADTLAVLASLALDTPAPPAECEPEIPARLSDLVMTLLQKKPEDRYATAREAAEALAAVEEETVTAPGQKDATISAVRATESGTLRPPRRKTAWVALLLAPVVLAPLAWWAAGGLWRAGADHANDGNAAGPPREGPRPAGPVATDLLAAVNPKTDAVEGHWQVRDGMLRHEAWSPNLWARLVLPQADVPQAYELELDVERLKQVGGGFDLGILVAGRQAVVSMDGRPGDHAWMLENIDGKNGDLTGAVAKGYPLEVGRRRRVVVSVAPPRVTAELDGEQILVWAGPAERLSTPSFWVVPAKDRLFLGTNSEFATHRLILRPASK